MAHDEDLAARIRMLTADEASASEQRMFGEPAFLIDGNTAVSASGQGGLLVRVDPAESDGLADATGAEVAVMGERRMHGRLHVAPGHLRSRQELAAWLPHGVAYARSLPAKRPGERRRG